MPLNREDFAAVIAYLGAGVGKSFSAEQAEVYFDLLGDLPLPILQAAARQALMESIYPTIPTPGALRQIALRLMNPDVPAAVEAWDLVRRAILRYGYAQEARALATLPEPVANAARLLGWVSLCDSTCVETCRAQFTKAYDALVQRSQRESLMPLPYRQRLAGLLEGVA